MNKDKSFRGKVTTVLDGNTFQLRLGKESAREMKILDQIVTVQLAYSHHLDANSLSGMIAKLELEKRLAGQRVHCQIVQEDLNRGFIATVDFNKLDKGFAIYD